MSKNNLPQYSYSKLGNKYNLADIEALDKDYHDELRRIIKLNNNHICFDCGTTPTNWVSINLGIFLCVDCAQIHRGVGTHISKIKSTGGSYRWHPDEMELISNMGNKIGKELYGDSKCNPSNNDFVLRKYSK